QALIETVHNMALEESVVSSLGGTATSRGNKDVCGSAAVVIGGTSFRLRGLSEYVVICSGPLRESWGVLHRRLAEQCVTNAHHVEFGWHTAQICVNAVKIGIGRAVGKRRCNCELRRCIVRNRFLLRVHEDRIDVRQVAKCRQKSRKLRGGSV